MGVCAGEPGGGRCVERCTVPGGSDDHDEHLDGAVQHAVHQSAFVGLR